MRENKKQIIKEEERKLKDFLSSIVNLSKEDEKAIMKDFYEVSKVLAKTTEDDLLFQCQLRHGFAKFAYEVLSNSEII